ncbi:hypothetical protein BX666DRAFT_1952427 [Dichotomocladium elegans]|nr:hypothetical protein BX666DRAFT_1952427 [Dichotomocladium elegans]
MYSPTANRLRDATATVRTRSPLGTPPLSASETAHHIQPNLTAPPIAAGNSYRLESSPSLTTPQDKLSQIFHAVRQQVQRWGNNAKWKIDLVLLDNNTNNSPANSPHLSLSPRGPPGPAVLHPTAVAPHTPSFVPPAPSAIPTITGNGGSLGNNVPVSKTVPYSMDFGQPPSTISRANATVEELRQQLHDAYERQRYLENIVRSQAEQLQDSQMYPPDANKAVETMRSIYMMSENEQKLRYLMDTKSLHKDMEALTRKLKRITSTLHSIETMKLSDEEVNLDKEALLQERILLKRKLHLAELRLSARDAEIEYLCQVLKTTNSHPSYYPHHEKTPEVSSPKQTKESNTFTSSPRCTPPYLFQQQYSPKMRHEIRLPPHQEQPQQSKSSISPLESLRIVADRMLNDPSGFSPTVEAARRSKRSIDSANTLLSMPQLKFPEPKENQGTYKMKTNSERELILTDILDVIMEEANAHAIQPEQPSTKKTRVESPSWGGSSQPNARHSPSIAALLDEPTSPIRHSPHHTPPLTHACEVLKSSSDAGLGASSSSQHSAVGHEPGYRPPSPASTPKGSHRSNAGS